MQFALTYAAGSYDIRGKLMGRQSAGVGFLRAALDARPARLWCHAQARAGAETFAADCRALSPQPPEIRFVPWTEPGRLAEAGLLYRPDPQIADTAWQRQAGGHARAYSLCGVTHTLSSTAAMSVAADLPRAPLYPWDAIVCTSRSARDVFRHILEAEMEHLRRRTGATAFTLPQLPLIPLGVHARDFDFTAEDRAAARAALGLGEGDVAALFAGRLSFHGKAHPLPMFLGLEGAARQTGRPVTLILFGQYTNATIRGIFEAEAARFAPSVRFLHLDGAADENFRRAWAAADLFTSLADNVQETFGLTPVEAMAAGLPCVVSDWNGYKDTVRHGVDGFRVGTALPPPGAGLILADRFDMRMDDYDRYIGKVSQMTVVDVASATHAYAELIASPELRARMGAAGRQRARDTYDWSLVFRRYLSLWEELTERRRADPRVPGEDSRLRRPDRPDPFALFAGFPTFALGDGTRVRLAPGGMAEEAIARRGLASVDFAAGVLPDDALIRAVLDRLAPAGVATVGEIAAAVPPARQDGILRAVAWLAKMGILRLC
ncbi:glycosyltransferase family 4 protein [Lichenibacterium dinghuense]|uniref:glycosyltransferase family 4 protein n=1 Tax=Lichenibacterium dinghuense TaxID=2895977 RepID=UPI001F3A3D53|nr:glycosyltransferase family 4 protein [Lichenibacterium sp. 6Y81]